MISKIKIILILIVLVFSFECILDATSIRILILKNQEKDIYMQGKFALFKNGKKIRDIENKSIRVKVENKKLKVNGQYYNNELFLKNISGKFFKINNYQYKGDLKLIFKEDLFIINYIDVEEYIKGVLPNEINASWHEEVLKAQAVAARSFAYYFIINNKEELYDLTDTTYSQVYKGTINEDSSLNKAINDTKDLVLVFRNELVQSFFHSACGGHTESAEKVWGKKLRYLSGVPCNNCSDAPYYKWRATFTQEEILNKLRAHGYEIDMIRAIRAAKRSSSGRWIKVKIIGRKKSVFLSGNQFRIILGDKKLRSTKFVIQRHGRKYIIKGKGWGHGVGMCQWGAKKKAEKGYKYYQILSYYYRGARVRSINSVMN